LKKGNSVLHEGAQPHWELVKKYDIIDFELGEKLLEQDFQCIKEKERLQRLDQLF
jgi:seryl-tRNA synthetase